MKAINGLDDLVLRFDFLPGFPVDTPVVGYVSVMAGVAIVTTSRTPKVTLVAVDRSRNFLRRLLMLATGGSTAVADAEENSK